MDETLKFKNTASECDNVSNVGNVEDWQYSDLKYENVSNVGNVDC